MKTKYKTKNHFSTFLAAISCFILLLSISSCEFFTFSDLKEKENAANATEQLNSEKIYKLHITPRFGNENLYKQISSRSAFPDFSSFDFSLYTFKATSSVLTQDATGTFNSVSGDISYSFSAPTSSEPVDFTFYICDLSGKELFYGAQQITYTTLGSEISKTVYFKSYDSSEVNGHIDLKVTVTSGYTLSCEIKNSSDESVCGNAGEPISIDSDGNITTGTDGIAPGTYKAYISVNKGSQLYDYIIQDINVWPDLTTNRWYLSDGSTSDTYTINISEDKVKFWVKGTSPGGPYASDVNVPASYTADGSILKPFASLNAAITACTSNSTDYIIKVCGTVSGNPIIDSTVNAHSISIEGVSGSDVDILDGSASGSVLKIDKALNVTLKNIQLTNGGGGTTYCGGGLYISSGANVVLENDVLITENTALQQGGGVYLYGANSKLTMKPGSKITKNYISATNNGGYEYGGGGVYVGNNSYSDTTAELVLDGGEISEHELAYEMRGAGVIVSYAKLTINSGKITKNKATDIAANVMLQNDSKMTMTGGEISYGEINGTAEASAAGVWINGGTQFEMSGGKICNNTVKAASTRIGRGAGVTAWQTGSTFIMTGGEISENKVDTTYSNNIQGGALCVYTTANCYFSGDINIPYGVNGTEGEGLNDIWIFNNNKITIKGKLSTPASGKIGAIKPQSYTEGKVLLEVADDTSPATTIKSEAGKFTLVPDSSSTSTWEISSTGGLQKAVEFAYPASTAGSFNGSSQISEVFKQNRKIGNIKSIVASDHETTQGEYELYCKYSSGYEPTTAIGKGDYYPVYKVCWYDAIIYCNLRSIAEDYEPVYVVDGKTNPAQWTGIDGNDLDGYCAPSGCAWDVTILADKNGWRLPTEIEWEYLARGGSFTNGYTYSGSNTASDVAWYGKSSGVNKVKQLAPNGFNLYDMSGNVWEWTNDWHSNATASPWIPVDTPSSGSYPDKSNSKRVTKGGGWSGAVDQSPVYNRGSSAPNDRNADMGFRVVRGAQYVGSKLPSVYKEVGDIVFNDGSAMSYEDYNALSSAEQNTLKANAIAIIFYKGTGLNNGSDTTTVRTLGVGLKHTTSNGKWCINQINTYISQIQSAKNGEGESTTFTGDLNGSDNFSSVVNYSGLSESEVETTYPVFEFARNYNNTATNITGTQYEDGWFIPSIAELFQIYINGVSSGKMFDLNSASESLGGNKFYNALYWASSQSTTTESFYDIQFPGSTYTFLVGWSPADIVSCRYCCIHEF